MNESRSHAAATPVAWCLALALLLLAASGASAQCEPRWIPGVGSPGVNSWVTAMVNWDPDGPGPRTSVLVLGGWFGTANNMNVGCIATWDPITGEWGSIGSGIGYYVGALAVLPNNDLVAGGWFESAGGVPASGIARWDGSAWRAMGSGVSRETYDSGVNALAVLPNGALIAAGKFASAGGVPVNNIARWDGQSWSALGGGTQGTHPAVSSLAVLHDGSLIAAGSFESIGGSPIAQLARWDGASWTDLSPPIGQAVEIAYPNALLTASDGSLLVAGRSIATSIFGAGFVARWDGSMWTTLGTGTNVEVLALTELPSGDIIAGGNFTSAGGVGANCIAMWSLSDQSWNPVGPGLTSVGGVFALSTLPSGDVMVGGNFQSAGGMPARCIARWGASCECVADLDDDGDFSNGGRRDGAVTIEDLLCYIAAFEAQEALADVDNGTATGTADGVVDAQDLEYFLGRFEAGC